MLLNPYKKIQELEEEIKKLRQYNLTCLNTLNKRHNVSSQYVEEILGRGIEWYDYRKMDKGAWIMYFNDAKHIVKNEVFNNELDHYITDLIKFTAVESKNFTQVENIRTGIITLQTFKQRLESIEDPKIHEEVEEPFNPI